VLLFLFDLGLSTDKFVLLFLFLFILVGDIHRYFEHERTWWPVILARRYFNWSIFHSLFITKITLCFPYKALCKKLLHHVEMFLFALLWNYKKTWSLVYENFSNKIKSWTYLFSSLLKCRWKPFKYLQYTVP